MYTLEKNENGKKAQVHSHTNSEREKNEWRENCERKTNGNFVVFFGTATERELLKLLSHKLHYTACCFWLFILFVYNFIRLIFAVKSNNFGL